MVCLLFLFVGKRYYHYRTSSLFACNFPDIVPFGGPEAADFLDLQYVVRHECRSTFLSSQTCTNTSTSTVLLSVITYMFMWVPI